MVRGVILFLLLFHFPTHAKVIVNYYKCVTERGTFYSKVPCGGRGTQHILTKTTPETEPEATEPQQYKSLNRIERKQIVRNLKNEIRAKKHEAATLNRERDQSTRDQQMRVSRPMTENERKETIKDIKRKLKDINKRYYKQARTLNKQISTLEKQLRRYE